MEKHFLSALSDRPWFIENLVILVNEIGNKKNQTRRFAPVLKSRLKRGTLFDAWCKDSTGELQLRLFVVLVQLDQFCLCLGLDLSDAECKMREVLEPLRYKSQFSAAYFSDTPRKLGKNSRSQLPSINFAPADDIEFRAPAHELIGRICYCQIYKIDFDKPLRERGYVRTSDLEKFGNNFRAAATQFDTPEAYYEDGERERISFKGFLYLLHKHDRTDGLSKDGGGNLRGERGATVARLNDSAGKMAPEPGESRELSISLIATNKYAKKVLEFNLNSGKPRRFSRDTNDEDDSLATTLTFSNEIQKYMFRDFYVPSERDRSHRIYADNTDGADTLYFPRWDDSTTSRVDSTLEGDLSKCQISIEDRSGTGELRRIRIPAGEDIQFSPQGTLYAFELHWVEYWHPDGLPHRWPRMKYRHYKTGKLLGQGTYGKVFQATVKGTESEIAVKKFLPLLRKGDLDRYRKALKEIPNLASLNHEHILAMYDYNFDGERLRIYMPLAEGSLTSLRDSQKIPHDKLDALAWVVLDQMLQALVYLESKRIIHLDIKPDNIVYKSTDQGYHFYLADFGLARELAGDFAFSIRAGFNIFMCHEYCKTVAVKDKLLRTEQMKSGSTKTRRTSITKTKAERKKARKAKVKRLETERKKAKQADAKQANAKPAEADETPAPSIGTEVLATYKAETDIWALFATVVTIGHPNFRLPKMPLGVSFNPIHHKRLSDIKCPVLKDFLDMVAWEPASRPKASQLQKRYLPGRTSFQEFSLENVHLWNNSTEHDPEKCGPIESIPSKSEPVFQQGAKTALNPYRDLYDHPENGDKLPETDSEDDSDNDSDNGNENDRRDDRENDREEDSEDESEDESENESENESEDDANSQASKPFQGKD